MKQSNWTQFLGLANRAQKVISGEDLVIKEVRNARAKLVLLSQDASDNTNKKVTDKCQYYNVPVVFVDDRYTLGKAIGKDSRVVVAVTDEGFATKLRTMLE
ncbi:YlxQ family RNA-binding protein [Bacillus sp. FJAT-47783]|uniref:YlxQ family RNA-binding protein n=1 Tax=Bacillus sp. FJAT-47783 TaxID=2922712 RepID=UPI001FAD6F92|nr:YlxQ family RNA-binding protein [Bacillus sp. FJAT-47783]